MNIERITVFLMEESEKKKYNFSFTPVILSELLEISLAGFYLAFRALDSAFADLGSDEACLINFYFVEPELGLVRVKVGGGSLLDGYKTTVLQVTADELKDNKEVNSKAFLTK